METGIFYGNMQEAYPGIDDLALLQRVHELGFKYIELDADVLEAKGKAFLAKAKALSIGFSVYAFADENCVMRNGKRAEEYLPFLAEQEVENLMMVCRPKQPTASEKERVNAAIISSLNFLCEKAAEYGINILVEDFDSNDIPCGSCEDMLFFAENIPKLGFTFDTGNFAFFGEDALLCLDRLKGKIRHVHLKDRVSVNDLTVTVTGKGGLPIGKIIANLLSEGYDGRMTVEMFGASTPERLKEALDFVSKRVK